MSSQWNILSAPPGGGDAGRGPALPKDYGVTRLALLPRDPGWLHAYWEVAPDTWVEVERLFGAGVAADGKSVLRFFLGENGRSRAFDLGVRLDARNWYVHFPCRAGRCRAELGLVLSDGRFALLAISNEVWIPSGRASRRWDERWTALREEWERLYVLSGGGRRGGGSMDSAGAPRTSRRGGDFPSWTTPSGSGFVPEEPAPEAVPNGKERRR